MFSSLKWRCEYWVVHSETDTPESGEPEVEWKGQVKVGGPVSLPPALRLNPKSSGKGAGTSSLPSLQVIASFWPGRLDEGHLQAARLREWEGRRKTVSPVPRRLSPFDI